MIIRNDIKHMPVQPEINHIVDALNLAIKKLKCKQFLLFNNNSIEDIAFLEIYKHNENRINADLIYIGEHNENIVGDKISYVGDDADSLFIILNTILNSKTIAVVNTDTLFIEKVEQRKINFNLEVFKDYTTEYLKEILKYYNNNIEINDVSNDNLSDKSKQILKDYILNNNLPNIYTREELKQFSKELPSRAIKNITLYNSITTNYIKGISDELEYLSE